jgi:hypothetical protein
MTTTEPTVGRIVHYWPDDLEQVAPEFGVIDASQPFAAIVTFVHDQYVVNLVVTDHYGNMRARSSVPWGRSYGRSGWVWPQIKPAAVAA